jgi:outer membrane immunogenic protein
MRWGALGSIGLIAFMGCTGPVVAQQPQSRPRPVQSYQPAPPPNWTGPQAGGFGGGSYGSPFSFAEPGAHLCTTSVSPSSFEFFTGITDGGLGPLTPGCFETPFQFSGHPWSATFGVFAGYNAQFGNLVAGVEGDVAWKRISSSQTLANPSAPAGTFGGFGQFTRSDVFTGSMTQRWDGSLRLRAGALVTPWTLAYGTAGGAVGSVCSSFSYSATLDISLADGGSGAAFANGADNWCETRIGYTVGAGVETAIALFYNSKLRFEYRYTDLGSFSRDVPLSETCSKAFLCVGSTAGNAHIDLRAAFHTFRVGIGFGL